jgi:hypothetical protein
MLLLASPARRLSTAYKRTRFKVLLRLRDSHNITMRVRLSGPGRRPSHLGKHHPDLRLYIREPTPSRALLPREQPSALLLKLLYRLQMVPVSKSALWSKICKVSAPMILRQHTPA